MKKFLLIAAAALLFVSCNKSDLTVYEGVYGVDNNTVVMVNNQNVNFSDFENARISIALTDGDNCEITLTNFINGQPEVIVPGTINETGTKSAAGATFYGSVNSGDRIITVEGTTSDATIASIAINEEITVDGIVGKWSIGGASMNFSHPDLEILDLSAIIPDLQLPMTTIVEMINMYLMQAIAEEPGLADWYLEFTSDGYIRSRDTQDEPDMLDIFGYYVKPEENVFGICLRKSLTEYMLALLDENPELKQMLEMFGLGSLIENPQGISVPLKYAVSGTGLSLTADQSLVDPYLDMISEPVAIIKAVLSGLQYGDVEEFIYENGLETFITEENFPAAIALVIDIVDALTDGQAQYSITLDLVPFAA